MKKIPFNHGWQFAIENQIDEFSTFGLDKYSDASGAAARFLDHNNWQNIDLPHDWTLSLTKNRLANPFAGAYPNTHYHRFMRERHSEVSEIYNIGWYRKQFPFNPSWTGKRVFIEFEGIFRDAVVFVNGVYLDRHTCGYTGFALDITDHLVEGEDNSVAVRVDCDQPEGWWYEGAGIYRNVHLLIGEPVYFKYQQTVVTSEPDGTVRASAVLVNDTPHTVNLPVIWTIHDADGCVSAVTETAVRIDAYSEVSAVAELKVAQPTLWSVDTPYLYTVTASADREVTRVRFGIRSVVFDADRGLLLNGVPLKVHGACVHQDFGGVGVALTDNLQYYKIRKLKEMGVNAYRCAHHPPSPVLLDACDEIGMLVMDETRMFGTSPEAVRQLTALIERDRNHPCVFLWCLGNEEFSVQNLAWSRRLMEKMTRITKALDPTRSVTYGGNNGADVTGANGAAEVRGINYIRNGYPDGSWIDTYHANHPTQPIIGTEESSYVLSRGGAENDPGSGLLDATGTVTMPWGSTPKGWVKYAEMRDYFAGSFMWTGFDYRGEPNPFYYANSVSCFGAIDLCGMEKPPFYYYQAWWTDKPVLKLMPHWNHRTNETVTVAVFTNCEEITLSLNGRTIAVRTVGRFDAPLFEVPFEAGVLAVDGFRAGVLLHDELVTAGETSEIRCVPVLEAETEDDIAIFELDAYDANGFFCPLASKKLEITAENGEIIGVGNGDPSNTDYERKPPEEDVRVLRSFRDEHTVFSIPMKQGNRLEPRVDYLEREERTPFFEDDFRIVAKFSTASRPDKTKVFSATVRDAEGFEYIEFERLGGTAHIYLNDRLIGDNARWYGRQTKTSNRPYRFYADFKEGENEIKVVIDYGDYDLPLISGEVKLGRTLHDPWHVRLHYGRARVFVKSSTPKDVRLHVNFR